MREYRPQWSALLFQGALFFAFLGANVFVIAMLIAKRGSHEQASLVALCIPGLLILMPTTGGIGWSLFHALAAYRIDHQGITRIRFGQQTLFLWREIVDFRFTRIGQSDTHWTLRDSAGRSMTVHTGRLERGYGLAGFIDTYLAPLRELKRTQIQQAPQVYRCGKAGSIAMVICSLVFFSMVGLAFFGSVVQPEPGWSVLLPLCTLVFGGIGALVLGYALHYATWTVRITPSAIIATSLFFRKSIAFSQIVAYFPNAVPLKSGQTQRTTEIVGQDGTKIKLNPVLMDYELLTANLQSMMNTPVLEQGERAKTVSAGHSRRQRAKFQMIGMPLVLLLILSMASYGAYYARMGDQLRLDRDGRITQGVVTGRSSAPYFSEKDHYLNFEFQAAGHTYQRASPVSLYDYNHIADGTPTRVTYIPSDPAISRMAASIGKHTKLRDFARIGLYVLLIIPAGISVSYHGWKTLRAENEIGEIPQ